MTNGKYEMWDSYVGCIIITFRKSNEELQELPSVAVVATAGMAVQKQL